MASFIVNWTGMWLMCMSTVALSLGYSSPHDENRLPSNADGSSWYCHSAVNTQPGEPLADRTPCLKVTRPVNGYAVISPTAVQFQLHVDVASGSNFVPSPTVEIKWFQIQRDEQFRPIYKCRNKRVCTAWLLDAGSTVESGTYSRHRFRVAVNYQGQKEFAHQDIALDMPTSSYTGQYPPHQTRLNPDFSIAAEQPSALFETRRLPHKSDSTRRFSRDRGSPVGSSRTRRLWQSDPDTPRKHSYEVNDENRNLDYDETDWVAPPVANSYSPAIGKHLDVGGPRDLDDVSYDDLDNGLGQRDYAYPPTDVKTEEDDYGFESSRVGEYEPVKDATVYERRRPHKRRGPQRHLYKDAPLKSIPPTSRRGKEPTIAIKKPVVDATVTDHDMQTISKDIDRMRTNITEILHILSKGNIQMISPHLGEEGGVTLGVDAAEESLNDTSDSTAESEKVPKSKQTHRDKRFDHEQRSEGVEKRVESASDGDEGTEYFDDTRHVVKANQRRLLSSYPSKPHVTSEFRNIWNKLGMSGAENQRLDEGGCHSNLKSSQVDQDIRKEVVTAWTPEPRIALRRDAVLITSTPTVYADDDLPTQSEETVGGKQRVNSDKRPAPGPQTEVMTPEPGDPVRKDTLLITSAPIENDDDILKQPHETVDSKRHNKKRPHTQLMTIVTPEPGVKLRVDTLIVTSGPIVTTDIIRPADETLTKVLPDDRSTPWLHGESNHSVTEYQDLQNSFDSTAAEQRPFALMSSRNEMETDYDDTDIFNQAVMSTYDETGPTVQPSRRDSIRENGKVERTQYEFYDSPFLQKTAAPIIHENKTDKSSDRNQAEARTDLHGFGPGEAGSNSSSVRGVLRVTGIEDVHLGMVNMSISGRLDASNLGFLSEFWKLVRGGGTDDEPAVVVNGRDRSEEGDADEEPRIRLEFLRRKQYHDKRVKKQPRGSSVKGEREKGGVGDNNADKNDDDDSEKETDENVTFIRRKQRRAIVYEDETDHNHSLVTARQKHPASGPVSNTKPRHKENNYEMSTHILANFRKRRNTTRRRKKAVYANEGNDEPFSPGRTTDRAYLDSPQESSAWIGWGPCSVTCGIGQRTRQVSCLQNGDTTCTGGAVKTRECVEDSCTRGQVSEQEQVDIVQEEGHSTEVECLYDNTRTPESIYWMSPTGEKITKESTAHSRKFKMSGDKLIIRGVQSQDGGTYHCVVVMGGDSVETADATIEVVSCKNDPCLNGGTCIELNVNQGLQFICSCPASFQGRTCDQLSPVFIGDVLAVLLAFSVLAAIAMSVFILKRDEITKRFKKRRYSGKHRYHGSPADVIHMESEEPLLTDSEIDLFREISREEFKNFKASSSYSMFKGQKTPTKSRATIDTDEIDMSVGSSIQGTPNEKSSQFELTDENSADTNQTTEKSSRHVSTSSSVKGQAQISSSAADSVSLPPSPIPSIERVDQHRSAHVALSCQGQSSVADVLSLVEYQESKPRGGKLRGAHSGTASSLWHSSRDELSQASGALSGSSVTSVSTAKRSLFDAKSISESRQSLHSPTDREDGNVIGKSQTWKPVEASTPTSAGARSQTSLRTDSSKISSAVVVSGGSVTSHISDTDHLTNVARADQRKPSETLLPSSNFSIVSQQRYHTPPSSVKLQISSKTMGNFSSGRSKSSIDHVGNIGHVDQGKASVRLSHVSVTVNELAKFSPNLSGEVVYSSQSSSFASPSNEVATSKSPSVPNSGPITGPLVIKSSSGNLRAIDPEEWVLRQSQGSSVFKQRNLGSARMSSDTIRAPLSAVSTPSSPKNNEDDFVNSPKRITPDKSSGEPGIPSSSGEIIANISEENYLSNWQPLPESPSFSRAASKHVIYNPSVPESRSANGHSVTRLHVPPQSVSDTDRQDDDVMKDATTDQPAEHHHRQQQRRASKFGYSGYVGRFSHILDADADDYTIQDMAIEEEPAQLPATVAVDDDGGDDNEDGGKEEDEELAFDDALDGITDNGD